MDMPLVVNKFLVKLSLLCKAGKSNHQKLKKGLHETIL